MTEHVDSPAVVIDGAFNVRDVAAGTANGPVRLAPGVLYRSATLSHVTADGIRDLAGLHVTTVLDLRSAEERERDGVDRIPADATVYDPDFSPQVAGDGNAADTKSLAASLLNGTADPAAMTAVMRNLYAGFANDGTSRDAIAGAVHAFAAAPAATIVHCSAGKDRTGWFVALTQTICGVDRDTVTTEYLRSNAAASSLSAMVPPGVDAAVLAPVLEVRAEYLDAAFDAVARDYGDVAGYLKAIGVTDDEVARIRARFDLTACPPG